MGTVGIVQHPWECGDWACIVAGSDRGLCGRVAEIRVGFNYESILVIRLQTGDEVEVPASDVIPA